MNVRRRSLVTGSAAVAALAALRRDAEADTAFTSFAFPATGAPTGRTMPNRLAEIKNVMDFGADPTGGSPSTSAIQAAVNSVSGAAPGVIYFPPGFYVITSPITFNYNGGISIAFRGEPGSTVVASPSFNDFLFSRNNVNSGSPLYANCMIVFEKLNLQNPNTGSSAGCIRLGSTVGAFVRDCFFLGQTCVTTEDSAGSSSQNILFEDCSFTGPNNPPYSPGAGIILGGTGNVIGCDFHDINEGVRAYGKGFHICGSRAEHCNVAFHIGVDSGGTDQGASGFSITSFTNEGNGTGIYLDGTCSAFLIGPGGMQGHPSSNSGYPTNVQASQYGLRMNGNCSAGFVHGYSTGSVFDQFGISIANASSRANIVFRGVAANESGGAGSAWSLPTNAYTVFFDGCNISPVWTFSQLPSGGNVFEGDEFSISDANSTTWGANVTGSSPGNHVLVRWNGTNWTVVGK